jgi:hypothetical protein
MICRTSSSDIAIAVLWTAQAIYAFHRRSIDAETPGRLELVLEIKRARLNKA